MYSTCLFCNQSLGANESIEHFPVGRRLAFDAAKGRLWVVCRKCERWNLTPLEERWEAIEECERAFRDTRKRVSTENIGLARLRDGTELVRIGAPQRPELAAWRYGDQFGRRRKNHLLLSGAGVVAVGGFIVLGPVMGIVAGSSWGMFNLLNSANSMYQERRVRVRLSVPVHEGELARVIMRRKQVARTHLLPVSDERRWVLRLAYTMSGMDDPRRPWFVRRGVLGGVRVNGKSPMAEVELTGAEALHAAARVLPQVNSKGAKKSLVGSAVQLLESHADPSALFANAAARASTSRKWHHPGIPLQGLPEEFRLALEMAAHEESERRALEGELALLESAWREAEEIAAISDDLLMPESAREELERLKKTGMPGGD